MADIINMFSRLWKRFYGHTGRTYRQGTFYLYGEQVYFRAAVARALKLSQHDRALKFEISIDLLQSLQHHDVIYRVDYALEQ